jgi:hypothetical protein
MKIVCHVDDVVDNLGYVGNGNPLRYQYDAGAAMDNVVPDGSLDLSLLRKSRYLPPSPAFPGGMPGISGACIHAIAASLGQHDD